MKLWFLIMTELFHADSEQPFTRPPQNQASDNPQLLGRAESLNEELLAKTLRTVIDVVGAVRGGVTFPQMQLLVRRSHSSVRPCGTHRHAALSRWDSVGL